MIDELTLLTDNLNLADKQVTDLFSNPQDSNDVTAEEQPDSKQLAHELLIKNNVEITEEKLQIISGLIESREKIPDASEIQSMNGEDLLNLFISLKVNKEVFNFTNKVKYVVKGLTVLKDESETITKAQVYLSGVVQGLGKKSDKWVDLSDLDENKL